MRKCFVNQQELRNNQQKDQEHERPDDMNRETISQLFEKILSAYGCDPSSYLLRDMQGGDDEVTYNDVPEFINACVRFGVDHEIIVLRTQVAKTKFREYVISSRYPLLVFSADSAGTNHWILFGNGTSKPKRYRSGRSDNDSIEELSLDALIETLYCEYDEEGTNSVVVVSVIPNKALYGVKDDGSRTSGMVGGWQLFRRLGSVIRHEKREIGYLFLYAVIAGVISLSLPLGVQSIVGFVSSGRIATSVIVLIALIVLGLLISGGMQIMQLYLAEYIQQRLFSKTAFEFAFRVPRIKIESVLKEYPPELVNRFFEIVTLQKGIAVILLEFSSAILQIIFGLVLLSLYHPLFIILGIILVTMLLLVFRISGPRGLETSMDESKYKYKVANWLEELARSMITFKLLGDRTMAVNRTDNLVSQYLYARGKHFKILAGQYLSFVLFKTIITGGLLIAGCVLIVKKEINLGQFIASEIVIILIMGSVEKLILKLDSVYDVLTSIDKISHVTDLAVDKSGTIVLPRKKQGMRIKIERLTYRFPDRRDPVLNGVNLDVRSGERICISGNNASGKTSLVNIMLGLLDSWDGNLLYDGLPLRNIDTESLLSQVGDYVSQEELLDGTLLENIKVGRPHISIDEIIAAIECAGLHDYVAGLPEGINTKLVGGGRRVPGSVARKIIIARAIVGSPRLLLLDDFLMGVERKEKQRIMDVLLNASKERTIVVVSNDPFIMETCDRVVFLSGGVVRAEGAFNDLKNNKEFNELLNSR